MEITTMNNVVEFMITVERSDEHDVPTVTVYRTPDHRDVANGPVPEKLVYSFAPEVERVSLNFAMGKADGFAAVLSGDYEHAMEYLILLREQVAEYGPALRRGSELDL
jgi:hypothetical protein